MANKADDPPYESSLSLRKMDPIIDVDDLMAWASDDQVSRFCRWDTYTSRNQAVAYIDNLVQNYPYCKVICLDNKAIGQITVEFKTGNDECKAVLGYVIGSKYWGQGIATWAVKAVVSTVFEEWPGVVRLEAQVDVENKASQRVLEKAGFFKEGVLRKSFILKGRVRDMIMFSFLSTDIVP